jgi:hypothetical protein
MAPKDERELQKEMQRLMAEVERSDTTAAGHTTSPSPQSAQKGLLTTLKSNFVIPIEILAIAWIQEIIDQVLFNGQFNLPIHPYYCLLDF